MKNEMDSDEPNKTRQTIFCLIVAVVLFPVGMSFLFVFGRFFFWFGDSFSAAILDGIALGLGVFWFVSVVALLLCLAVAALKND